MPEEEPTLIIVCGLPGSGKTTHGRALAESIGAVRLCADEWMEALGIDLWDEGMRARVEALQRRHAQELLSAGVTVTIEWGTWAREERDELRRGAQAVGARAELHYLSAPVDVLFERVRARGMEDPPITRSQLMEWSTVFQAPTADELALFDGGRVIEQRS